MASSLSDLVNNLSEGINTIKCKIGHNDKKCETFGNKYNYCSCFLEYINLKDDLIDNKCLRCNKNYQHMFDKKLKERFFNTCNFSNHDNNSLFYYCEKVFIPMNIWMIGKNSVKHRYMKNKIFTVT